jgi:hypothetical protein
MNNNLDALNQMYAMHSLNKPLNATIIKNEQQVLSAFRSENMYDQEHFDRHGSIEKKIRSNTQNLIPNNPNLNRGIPS